jgi:hypothetical protein
MNANSNARPHSAAALIRQILAENAAALQRYLARHAEDLTLEQIENLRRQHDDTARYLRKDC